MRRRFVLMLAVFLCCLFAVSARADSSVSGVHTAAVVSPDGSCRVTATATITVDSARSDLAAGIPMDASSVTLNGSRARVRTVGDQKQVDLTRLTGGQPGTYSVTLQYVLPDVVVGQGDAEDRLRLSIPLLSGYEYPITQMEFTVTMPEEIRYRPIFSSGYHQESIETELEFTVTGAAITGRMNAQLKDHETLTMTLEAPRTQFPGKLLNTQTGASLLDYAAWLIAGLALLYWLVFLRAFPALRARKTTPPEGLTAGEVAGRLAALPTDLTLMVLSWAQLGYILIQIDDSDRILLHKRMEMGNERSPFEVRTFQRLFGKKKLVDGTGRRYYEVYKKTASVVAQPRSLFLPASGNPRLLRVIAAVSGAASGGAIALALSFSAYLQVPLVIVFAVLAAMASWQMHNCGPYVLLRGKRNAIPGLLCAVLWLTIGFLAGKTGAALLSVIIQLVVGTAAAYGGRRSDSGKRVSEDLLGLRRYMKSVSGSELRRILQTNPAYYFDLAPYALALGVDKAFARRFGKTRLVRCSYLVHSVDTARTASEWCVVFREAVKALDAQCRPLPWEKLFNRHDPFHR